MIFAAVGFDIVTSLFCALGIFYEGWISVAAWVCIGIIIIKDTIMGLAHGFGGLLASYFVAILIPAAVAVPLGIFVWHLSAVKIVFLTGAFHCVVGWVSTIFDL